MTSNTDAPTQDGKVVGVTTTNDDPVQDVRRVSPRVENRGKERSFSVSRHEAHAPESSTIPMKPPVQEKRIPSKVSRAHVSPKERTPGLTAEKEPVSTQDKLTSSIHRKKSKGKEPAHAAVWESLDSDLISREILAWQNEGSTGQDPEPMLAGSAIDITDEVNFFLIQSPFLPEADNAFRFMLILVLLCLKRRRMSSQRFLLLLKPNP